MKSKALLILLVFSASLRAQSVLTVEKIMRDPKWIGTSPSEIYWSPDSKEINFKWNPEGKLLDSLYGYSINTKKTNKVSKDKYSKIPPNAGVFSSDMKMKTWSSDGDIYLHYLETGHTKLLFKTAEFEYNPSFSADLSKIIFQKNNDVYVYEIANGFIKQLIETDKGSLRTTPKKSEEETWLENQQLELFDVLKERKQKANAAKKTEKSVIKKIYLNDNRLVSMSTSPSLSSIAFTTSETPKNGKSTVVPNYVATSGYTEDIPARNKVGSPQNTFLSFIYNIEKDTVLKINAKDLPGLKVAPKYFSELKNADSLIKNYNKKVSFSNFTYSDYGSKLIATARSDDNKDRWIVSIDTQTGKAISLDHQHDDAWIGGPGIGFGGTLGFLNENTIFFQSEETGYSHLYTLDLISNQKTALTKGKYEVLKVELSQKKDVFYITTNEKSPTEQHFYHLTIDGLKTTQITNLNGAHEVSVSPDEKYLAIRYSYANKPWELYLQKNEAKAEAIQITNSISKEFQAYPWRDPKIIQIKASDAQDIYARIYEPKKSNKKAVIFVHGAGYLQNAHKWWSSYFREYMFHNLLTDLGYTVLDIDYRASAGYGRDVRTGIYRYMGGKDLSDHVDAAAYLVKNHSIDKSKIGIYGGSYGGFITLMALFTAPDVFKAGAALRPVTDWAAYNHGYTSNILNTPQSDSLAFKRSSPINFASGLKNNLLICHGVVDVNVHYQDVVRLSQKLIELGKKNWEMASYPVEDHGFVEPSSWTDEYNRILKLFEEKLK
jgi:dipeptidyl aminopeptidase/acylaminoacyl peptidase